MIAVVGRVAGIAGADGGVSGLAGAVAIAAAGRGARVEAILKLGDDPDGDRVLLTLNRAGVGHAAILRDPARRTPMTSSATGTAAPGDDDGEAIDLLGDAAGQTRSPGEGEPPPGLELAPADLELALEYLADLSVIVLADPSPSLVPIAAEGAAFAAAALVIAGDLAAIPPGDVPAAATILAAPAHDPDGAFAALVAEYAVALDAGRDPAAAWDAAMRRVGAEPA
jgi:hypothetical protein